MINPVIMPPISNAMIEFDPNPKKKILNNKP